MSALYQSAYYEMTQFYERFGNVIVHPGTEIYLYIDHVPGLEYHRYSISNKMRVYDYKQNEFVRISYNTNYPSVNLYDMEKNKIVTNSLHRVYMLTFCYFIGCEQFEVNRIDGNKMNCIPSNLEWMTHQENMNHAFDYIIDTKLSPNKIIELIQMYNRGETMKSIAEKFGITTSYVSDIVRGKSNREDSIRLKEIKRFVPVTREKFTPKLSDNELAEIAVRYSNGEEYFELANEYGIDRSGLTKMIKRYAKSHPEIILRPLKKITPEMAEIVCKIFQDNIGMNKTLLFNLCLDELGLENNESNRKAIKNIYNRNTHKGISSKYNW